MTSAYMTQLLTDIDALSAGIDQNKLIANTRAAVIDGIDRFTLSDAEKSKLYANFEIQFSLGVVGKVIDAVVNSGLIEQQIELEKAKIALANQQLLSEQNNTEKLQAEIALLGSNKALVDAQTLTEGKRKLDVIAGINIKNEQVLATRQSAKFEESRRFVLLESTKFNNQIQKADKSTAFLNSLALDNNFTITEAHLTSVKNDINAITVADITYTEEITQDVAYVNPGT